jgi:hypothetical protein
MRRRLARRFRFPLGSAPEPRRRADSTCAGIPVLRSRPGSPQFAGSTAMPLLPVDFLFELPQYKGITEKGGGPEAMHLCSNRSLKTDTQEVADC